MGAQLSPQSELKLQLKSGQKTQSLRESKQAFSPTSQASGQGAQLSPQVPISFASLDIHLGTRTYREVLSGDALIPIAWDRC